MVQEANLSCSTAKNGQGVSRLRTCLWKANSLLDQKAVAMERIRELTKRRGRVLSALMMAKPKEIDSLLTDENNLEAVEVKLREITDTYEEYNADLIDESQRQESLDSSLTLSPV